MAIRNSYQVKETDKNLLTLAARLKLEYNQVKSLNPNITSISTGQYINLPPTPPKIPGGPPKNSKGQMQYAAPAGPPALQYSTPAGPYLPTSPSMAGMGGLGAPVRPKTSINFTTPANTPAGGAGNQMVSVPGPDGRPRVMQYSTYLNLTALQGATDPSQLPASVPGKDLTVMGFTPEQMSSAGYVLQAGNWVLPGRGTVAGSGAAAGMWVGPSGTVHQSANNWETNDALRLVTINRNAQNRNNRYVTNLKHAKTMWQHKKQAAKGARSAAPVVQPGIVDIRADAPSTTLDLILGS